MRAGGVLFFIGGVPVNKVVRLDLIDTEAGTQLRPFDRGNMERLRLVLQEGGDFNERMRIWTDGANYWPSHGFHRLGAYVAEGYEEVEVELHKGTLDEAIDDACRPWNSEHGKPETAEERRARVRTYVERHMREAASKSAEWCGVSKKTIINYKHDLQGVSGQNSTPAPQEDDSSTLPVWPEVADGPDDFTCPNCGGHEADEEGDCLSCYEPAEPAEPEEDEPTPDIETFNSLLKSIRAINSMITALAKTKAGAFIVKAAISKRLREVRRELERAIPSAACPKCSGRGCLICRSTGCVPENIAAQLTKED